MGLKDRLKDLLVKGKCLIGLHQGEWRAASPTECTFTRICVECGATHHKVEHVWPEWAFVADGSCDQTRSCNRCSLREERLSHAWGEADYVSNASCDQQQVCVRCREAQPAPARHVMDWWRYTSADACTQVQQCSRCHADGAQTRIEHLWAEWQHSNAQNGAVRVCRRCGEMQVQSMPAAAPAPSPQAAPGGKSRTEMYDLQGNETAAHAGAAKYGQDTLAPSSFTDDDVADLIARAEASQQTSSQTERDTRLEGHWRCTPPALSSGGYTMTTDIHLVLDDAGRFARWSKSIGPMGPIEGDREYGSWASPDGTLVLSYDDGNESVRSYEVHARDLLFPQGGSQAYWVRVG